jgi:hypothetical protein
VAVETLRGSGQLVEEYKAVYGRILVILDRSGFYLDLVLKKAFKPLDGGKLTGEEDAPLVDFIDYLRR